MGQKIVVGPINKGLRTDRTAFVIDNDSFPTLINAYQWRGRVKRKRGTSLLCRLQRFFNSTSISYTSTSSFNLVAGAGNLISGFSLQTNSSFVPGTITITDNTSGNVYTDDNKDGNLFIDPSPTIAGTINYANGAIALTGTTTDSVSASFVYNPDLPVLGLEDLQLIPTQFPGTLAFDDTYSYNILTAFPYSAYDVSFYKNPASGAYTDGINPYVQKTNPTPLVWNGQDYQQFYSANYQGALWATNGITIPFTTTNLGMQFKVITTVTVNSTTNVTLTIATHGLVIGDFLFINEVVTTTGINFQTGYVYNIVDANNVKVVFPNANIATNGTGGIAQYLTSSPHPTKDCIRWYDGDPTNGNATNPTLTPGKGWVNFTPPLSNFNYVIADLPAAQYYLLTARMIVPFKDRLLCLGPVVCTSGGGIFYLQDTIIYSQNGTPYYTCSFQAGANYPLPPVTGFYNQILVPANQTATPSAWFEDSTGFGGFVSAGISQPITTVSSNEDALVIGFSLIQTKIIFSGNDLVPFNFYIINSELGSASTFSTINMDRGVVTRGTRGYIITSQTESQRIDLEIPDQVFEINLTTNGNERFCAARDFINEWIYFSYPSNSRENNSIYRYPDQTLLYNYRDNSWAIFNESYTTYGAFRRQTGFVWETVGMVYPTWESWNEPWEAGDSTLLQQEVIAGNQQGFIVVRDEGTGEATSLYIQGFNTSTNIVTSPDHNLSNQDYIMINGCLGSIGTYVNGEIFSVFNVTQNTFQLNPTPAWASATYFGSGLITKIYVPQIQTKQFPVAWDMARKTRLGPQQYLFTTTNDAQITLQIFLSQNSSSSYNSTTMGSYPIVPQPGSVNNSLIYSAILYTCPESTNLGLTPANTNLQMLTAPQQGQTWHRMNTSLIGDTVQIGFTLSDAQIRDLQVNGTPFSIMGATTANPCVLTCAGQFETGQLIQISGIVGMTQLNGNIYQVLTSSSTTVTINVNSSTFTAYISGGTATPISGINGFSEIELHGFILDTNPSQLLA
jgi:hypothetical protein